MAIEQSTIQDKLHKILEYAQKEFSVLRTGRATVQLLDAVRVSAYGSMMSINEVASVTAPDAQLLLVKPWDKSLLAEIEKGIQVAQLNLNPIVDGDLIRIVVPALTQERRQELVKVLNQKAEEVKVLLRNARTDFRRDIEKQKGQAGISEDDIKQELANLDEAVKKNMEQLDTQVEAKEKELLSL